MSLSFAETAERLGCSERTLRRYVNGGLLRGDRRGGRGEITLPYSEERYLWQHWETLSRLRRALRTEHSVRLAVLFGSVATGEDRPDSDIDLLIEHATGDFEEAVELQRRLQVHVSRPLHLVLLDDTEQSPALLAEVLREGRVLVDRHDAWRRFKRTHREVLRQAVAEEHAVHEAARRGVDEARERLYA